MTRSLKIFKPVYASVCGVSFGLPSVLIWCVLASADVMAKDDSLVHAPAQASVYYVDPETGDDASAGTSPQTAWRSLAKLNAVSLGPNDVVKLRSGAVFQGPLYLDGNQSGTASEPLMITTDGAAPATILAGTGHGVFAYNTGGIVFENLVVEGAGIGENTGTGLMFYTDQPGRRPPIVVQQVSASGFGDYGLYMSGWREDDQLSGFSGLTVRHGLFFNNELGGLMTWAHQLYGIENVLITHSTFHSNPGRAGFANPSGSGVVLGRTDGGVIEYSVAHHNGAANTNSAGPVAIWAYDSNNVVIQHNLAYENKSAGGDGGGFDLDGGSTNSILQYNFSYNNDGAGYLLAQYQGAPMFGDNVVRYNISQNDGRRRGYGGITLWAAQAANPVRDTQIYHNTVYISSASHGTPAAVRLFGGNFDNVVFRNNLLIAEGVDVVDADVAVPTTEVLFQGNLYDRFDQAGPSIRYGQTLHDTLSSWRAATGQETVDGSPVGLAATPVWCHPSLPFEPTTITQIQSMSHYRMANTSPTRDAGLILGDWGLALGGQDFFGNPLTDGQPDVGAHEIVGADCGTLFQDSFQAWPE